MPALVLTVLLFAGPTTATAEELDTTLATLDESALSALVEAYDEHAPFSGVANDTLPEDLDAGLQLGVVEVELGSSDKGMPNDGFIDFGETSTGTHIIGASDGPGMNRFGIIIDEPGAPEEYRFGVNLPSDAIVHNAETGAVHVTSAEGDTTLAPALAVDAEGKRVPAHYQIVDDELLVEVDLSTATLPVLVDPVTSTYWWGSTTWYSRSDVRWQADWYSVIRVAKSACNWAPGHLRAACNATVGRYTSWIYNTWQHAKNTNQCLAMSMTWTGQITNIYAYRCNWG